jgi:hypothetical protein
MKKGSSSTSTSLRTAGESSPWIYTTYGDDIDAAKKEGLLSVHLQNSKRHRQQQGQMLQNHHHAAIFAAEQDRTVFCLL